jgi:hypothetical protein
MARRRGSRQAAAGAPEASRPAGQGEQLDAFCRGLYPILLEGDPTAFRRYLAEWEDVVGDTADLADTPPEQQRRTMAAMLRYPQRFNLPPWPGGPVVWPPANASPPANAAGQTGAVSWRRSGAPGDGPFAHDPAGEPPRRTVHHRPAVPHPEAADTAVFAQPGPARAAPIRAAAALAGPAQPAGIFQLDMLTGEFVPVPPGSARPPAEHPPAEGAAEEAPARRARSRRRRPSGDLEQLALW